MDKKLLPFALQDVPRYTSYPTAVQFQPDFPGATADKWLTRLSPEASLSVYVHIPFCRQLCWYCGCHTSVPNSYDRAARYVEHLIRDIERSAGLLNGRKGRVKHFHFGGGTPTYLDDMHIAEILAAVDKGFGLASGAEVALESDPRTLTRERARILSGLGFNRISFGVQDFDPEVQAAVHRIQPFDSVQELMAEARALRFESINADLIYGLPKQSPESFRRTIAQVAELRPTRIALYAYAHLPQRFKPQRRIVAAELPSGEQRVQMLGNALAGFIGNGYVYIGMDHFALPTDALAVAKRQGRLHRNFQGYTTQPDCDLIGLGVSAIGRVGATYSQNAKTLAEYEDALAQGELPIVRGLALTRDDLLRRSVIMALMCQGRVEFESIELAHLINMRETFASEFERLKPLQEMGLVEVSEQAIQVTPTGWFFVRAVAMTFDRHLQADKVRERFSRII